MSVQTAMTQGRFALDQMVAEVRNDFAKGVSEEEQAAELVQACMRNPEGAIAMAVVAVIELAKREAF